MRLAKCTGREAGVKVQERCCKLATLSKLLAALLDSLQAATGQELAQGQGCWRSRESWAGQAKLTSWGLLLQAPVRLTQAALLLQAQAQVLQAPLLCEAALQRA